MVRVVEDMSKDVVEDITKEEQEKLARLQAQARTFLPQMDMSKVETQNEFYDVLRAKSNYICLEHNLEKLHNSPNNYAVFADWISKGNTLSLKEIEWDSEFIFKCFTMFKTLMGYIGEVTLIIPTIEIFSMFMNWNASFYDKLLSNPVYYDVMGVINDYLLDAQLSLGQAGRTTIGLTKLRVQTAGEHGFKQTIQKSAEAKAVDTNQMTQQEMLESIAMLKNVELETKK